MSALETFGDRQQQLLRHLLYSEAGSTVDELSRALSISRNAVNQHIASLEGSGFISSTTQAQARGRPSNLYSLTLKGRELFPRHYDLFSSMLLRVVRHNMGDEKFRRTLDELGEELATGFRHRVQSKQGRLAQLKEIARILHELGYEARFSENGEDSAGNSSPEIIASNCVYHKLAEENPDVCQLDLSLMSRLLGEKIEHRECMVRGGTRCRFGICAGTKK